MGPGEITGDLVAIVAANLVVTDITIHDAEAGGIAVVRVPDPKARLGKVVATNVAILDSASGILAKTVYATGLEVSRTPYYGVNAHQLRGAASPPTTTAGSGPWSTSATSMA
jgi:hypothetical protein